MESEFIVKTTRVGLIMNALSLLKEIGTKEEFALGLLRGFTVNFLPRKRLKFFEYVFLQIFQLTPPSGEILKKTPLKFYFDKKSGGFVEYKFQKREQ